MLDHQTDGVHARLDGHFLGQQLDQSLCSNACSAVNSAPGARSRSGAHSNPAYSAAEYPELEFVRPCNLCPFMKKIELENILTALEEERHEVHIDPAIAGRARVSVERMLTGWKP